MMEMEYTGQYTRNPDVVLRDEDKEGGLLFNPDTNQVLVLNATAVHVWKLCDGVRDLDSIVSDLKTEFSVDPETTVAADVERFLKQMADGGFLGRGDGAAASGV